MSPDIGRNYPGGRVRVLGFGTYDVARHPRAGVLLDGLRAHGDEVVELNEPLGFSTAERVAMLARPWLAYRLVCRLLVRWTTLVRRRISIRTAWPAEGGTTIDAVIVGYLGQFDVLLARLLFPRTRIVLDLLILAADTASDRGERSGPKLRLLSWLDSLAIRCADVIVVDTEEHRQLLRPDAWGKVVVVAVGAPPRWFGDGGASERPPAGPLRVAFFGLYTPLQGARVIGAALDLLAAETTRAGTEELAVTMIGTGQDYQATRTAAAANRSVTWLEWLDPDQLPGLIATHHVCLGVFGTSPKALRVVPNKVYQGAAAGCAIVTSATEPQRRALADDAIFVPPGDPVALCAALTALARD
ncbi:MAG: glycosyltransferase, partial [Actinomycetota bacterium]|nr:glycosyltransferase [Actinomycetota bacterium]